MRFASAVELRDLETFVVVAEELHFARAAARLHVVPAAVTQRIRSLEERFGLELFRRTSRRVELTDAGLRLVESARAALRAVDETEDLARELSGEQAARLSIAVGPNLGAFLAPVLARLSGATPGLRPTGASMWSTEAASAVQRGEVVAAIVRGPVLVSGVESISIGETVDTHVALPADDPLTRLDRPLDRRDLDGRPVLVPDRAVAPGPHEGVSAYFQGSGAHPLWRSHRLQGFELLLPFVAISGAAALVPAIDAATLPEGVTLRMLAEPAAPAPVLLLTRSDDAASATVALRAIASELAPAPPAPRDGDLRPG